MPSWQGYHLWVMAAGQPPSPMAQTSDWQTSLPTTPGRSRKSAGLLKQSLRNSGPGPTSSMM